MYEIKMVSLEVYDVKQEKWVPYIPDFDKWYQHFKDLSEGYVQPDYMDAISSALVEETGS